VRHRCSARQGTHCACVDPHRTGERGAGASASPQPQSCSRAAKCVRARARSPCCSLSLRSSCDSVNSLPLQTASKA
jgi:hypothetical protein